MLTSMDGRNLKDLTVARLTTLATPVLREQVRDALRDAILSGEIPAGTHVSERETADALGVSRTPVREAISELRNEGLLAFHVRRGAIVVGVHDDEIEAAYRIKTVLEEEAMARAASRMTAADFVRLERIVADMEHLRRMNDFPAVSDADVRFHAAVADVADFGLLRRVWTSVDEAGRLTTRHIYKDGHTFEHFLEDVVESHRILIDVLRNADPILASDAARQHLLNVQRRYQLDLDQVPSAPKS